MTPGLNIISGKASTASVKEAGRSGVALRKSLGSKRHSDWLKMVLNAAEIITVQDYKRTKI